ncbi:MAG: hypothetical protein JNL82_35100 [Myxococcales bacterium]|nr:hypothetical protein [Myxococcales bacterium]
MLWNERYRRGCDCHLVVLTTSRRVAAWAARPIRCGDSVTHLLVRGPDQIPRITDPIVAAATPELAVLSASIHGADPGGREVVETALSVLPSLPPSEARMYNLFIHRALSVAAIERLREEIMYFSDMKEMVDNWKFDEHGMPLSGYEVLIKPMLIEERRRFILDAVTARGLGNSDEIRARVDGCVDVEVLRRWAHQALTARTADEIFAA